MPPVNDNIADATQLTGGGGTVFGSTVGATIEDIEKTYWFGNVEVPTTWYYYKTPPGKSRILNIFGIRGFGNFEDYFELTFFWLPNGIANTLEKQIQLLEEGWDGGTGGESQYSFGKYMISYTMAPGNSYYLMCANTFGDAGVSGLFEFSWSAIPIPSVSVWLPSYKVV